jgi:hypothetical protein
MMGIYAHDLDVNGKIIMSRDWVYCRRGFGLVIQQIITTNDYDSLTELNTPKITATTAHIKSSQASLVVA